MFCATFIFQTRSRACLKNVLETDTAEKEDIKQKCSKTSKEKKNFYKFDFVPLR